MDRIYNNLINNIKPTLQNINGTDVVVVDIESFSNMLSEFLKNHHYDKSNDDILKDLKK